MDKLLGIISQGGFALTPGLERAVRVDNNCPARPQGRAGLFYGVLKRITPKNGNKPFTVFVSSGSELPISLIESCEIVRKTFNIVIGGTKHSFDISTHGRDAAEVIIEAWQNWQRKLAESYIFTGQEKIEPKRNCPYILFALTPFNVWREIDLRQQENWLLFRSRLGELTLNIDRREVAVAGTRKVVDCDLIQDIGDRYSDGSDCEFVFRVRGTQEYATVVTTATYDVNADSFALITAEKISKTETCELSAGDRVGTRDGDFALIDSQRIKIRIDQAAINARMDRRNQYYTTGKTIPDPAFNRPDSGDDADGLIAWICS
jgi:hypothetical protein